MAKSTDIYKAAGIIIKDRKLLFERSQSREYLIAPGGRIEDGETAKQALVRELREEFNIEVREDDLEVFGSYVAPAVNHPGRQVHMQVFVVRAWKGEPTPGDSVEEMRWLDSNFPAEIKVGSIFGHVVVPALKAKNMID